MVEKPIKDLDMILNLTSIITNIPKKEIIGKSRKREIVQARHVYCIVSYDMTDFSYSKIGYEINKDHATVMHGIKSRYIKNTNINSVVESIIKRLTNNEFKLNLTNICETVSNRNTDVTLFINKIVELINTNKNKVAELNDNISTSINKIKNSESNNGIEMIINEINNIEINLKKYLSFFVETF